MQTKITLYNSYESRFDALPEQLPRLIKRLTEELEKVPTEFHDEVYLEISSETDTFSVDVDIYYCREETAEEEAKRLNDQAVVIQAYEDRMRREYEKLKAKFEP